MLDENINSQLQTLHEALGKLATSYSSQEPSLQTLYHYTNWDGLYGILNTKELWLTHHGYLNDPTEIAFSLEVIEKNFQEFKSKIEDKNSIFWGYFLNEFKKLYDQFSIYIFSFCPSQDLMPLWRYYANNGVGFSIGFKKDHLEQLISGKTYDVKIQYDENKYGEFVKACFEKANDTFCKIIKENSINSEIFENISKGIFSNLALHLIPTTIAIKNKGFEDEIEWRIYKLDWKEFFEIPQNQKFFGSKNILTNHFANTQHSFIPRVKIQINLDAIKEITIGPACNVLYAKHKLKELLSTTGYQDLPILISKWKYR